MKMWQKLGAVLAIGVGMLVGQTAAIAVPVKAAAHHPALKHHVAGKTVAKHKAAPKKVKKKAKKTVKKVAHTPAKKTTHVAAKKPAATHVASKKPVAGTHLAVAKTTAKPGAKTTGKTTAIKHVAAAKTTPKTGVWKHHPNV